MARRVAAAAVSGSGGTRIAWPGVDRIAGAGALAVDPDLPGAQQLFEPAVAEAGIMPLEPAVEPAGAVLRPHRDGFDAGHFAVGVPSRRVAAACPNNPAAS